MKKLLILFITFQSVLGVNAQIDMDSSILNALNAIPIIADSTNSKDSNIVDIDTLTIAPIASFDTLDFEFGNIKNNAIVVRTYSFKNIGNDTLYISDIIPDCSCTVPGIAKYKYGPNENGTITVTFDSKNYMGKILQNITVVHNAGKGYSYLTLSGFIVSSF